MSKMAPRETKQRQTRLSFTPLPSSSPSTRSYPPSIQGRLANIRYETPSRPTRSSRKMEPEPEPASASTAQNNEDDVIVIDSSQETFSEPDKPNMDSMQGEAGADAFPTPVNSSQHKEEAVRHDENSGFASSPIEAEQDTSEHIVESDSSDDVVVVSRRPRLVKSLFDPDDETLEAASAFTTPKRNSNLPINESPGEGSSTVRRSPCTTRGRGMTQSSPTKRRRSPTSRSSSRRQTRSGARETRRSTHLRKTPLKSRTRQQESSSFDIGEAETSNDEDITITGTKIKSRRQPAKREASFIDDTESEDIESSPVKRLKVTPRKRQPAEPASSGVSIIDDDSDEIEVTPVKRSKITPRKKQSLSPQKPSPKKHARKDSRREQEDLEEDLADLNDSTLVSTRTRTPKSRNTKKRAQQKILDKLRRKQDGDYDSDDNTEIEYVDRSPRIRVSLDDEEEATNDDRNEDSGSISDVFEQHENLDKYEDDFVDDTLEGAEEYPNLPIEFSGFARKPPKELFKYVVEWLIHNKINPAFERGDEIYKLAFDKLGTEAKGLAGQAMSSSWGPHPKGVELTKMLLSRPEIVIVPFDNLLEGKHCDACNRSGHPARFEMSFDGPTYDPVTLERNEETSTDDDDSNDMEKDASDGENNDQDNASNSSINSISKLTFYMGSTCKANAEKAHNLTHWKYHLNAWIHDYLSAQSHLDAASIVARDSWTNKKKERLANRIVDEMSADGEIEKLYRDLRLSIREARGLQQPERDRFFQY